ncbi:glutamate receptor ionotropic, delta-2-like isoform X2 [Macrobrachium rosenbergii]|uniref:glutamate receptor ionotropic, delta-2-like isoform X2 n=1 Tax=Macrobrachium rosenbergii TaxID=79674 RepID=UPI0034D4C51C
MVLAARIRLVIFAACIEQSMGRQSFKALVRSRANYASGCVNADEKRDLLIQSVVHLAGTLLPTNLRIVFQRDPDLCLMESLWRGNIAAQILTEKGLWDALKISHYEIPTQIILYGDASWLASSVGKAASYYDSAKLNAMITRWLWVDATIYNGGFTNHDPLNNLTASSVPSNFLEAMDFVSSFLQEGMRGLFIAAEGRSLLSGSSLSPPEEGLLRWVNIAAIKAPGNGLWKLEFSGSWSSLGLRILRPLWPGVSFNLLGRTVRISCLKKPTVFDYEGEATHLKETNGYGADLAKEIQQRLNFTDILVRSDGFGAFADGKWNGMVGDLYEKKADVSPTDFTPIWQRTLVIDFGLAYGTDPVVIISKAPSVYMKPLLLLEIFTLDAWACIVGIGLVAGVATGALMKIKKALGHPSTGVVLGPLGYAAGYMSVIVSQPCNEDCWTPWIGGQVIGGCVMFFSVVLGSLYKSLVTAFLAIPFRSQPINSLEDMLRRNVIPAIRLLSSPYSFFLTENSGKVGERVRNTMVTFNGIEVSEWKFLKKVADGTYAWIDTASSAIGSSNQFEAIGKPCLYHVANNPVRIDLDAFAYPKNSIVKYQFDEIMKWLRNYGIIEKMKKTYYSINCITVKASDGPQVINIAQGFGTRLAYVVILFSQ